MSVAPADPQPTPAPDLSASAERLLTTVATAAESAIVHAGSDLESRLARAITSLNDRIDAASQRPRPPSSE